MAQVRRFQDDKIIRYYSQWGLVPAEPSEFVKKYGSIIFDFFENSIQTLFNGNCAALVGYYTNNVKLEITEHRLFFSDPNQTVDFVESNILLFELIYDILCFDKYGERINFISIFGKYCNFLIGDAGPEFSDWVNQKKAEAGIITEEESKEMMLRALNAFTFVIFHEFAHMRPELVNATTKMILDEERIRTLLEKMDDVRIEEIACDYNALYAMTCSDLPLADRFQNGCGCSETDTLIYGMIMLNAEQFLDLLKCCFSFGNTLRNHTVNEVHENLMHILNTRLLPLLTLAKLTVNTENMNMGDVDVLGAIDHYQKLIGNFFDGIIAAMNEMNELMTQVSQKQGEPATITCNDPISDHSIWYLVK